MSDVLIRQSTTEGELVLDPFVGSGSTGVAAIEAQRCFLGADICDEALEITRQRLVEAGGGVVPLNNLRTAKGRLTLA